MSQEDREKWDRRYADGAYADRPEPAEWLNAQSAALQALWAAEAAEGTCLRALDLACGNGRNARHLAHLGFAVDAVDISPIGLSQAAAKADKSPRKPIQWHQHDLDEPLPAEISGNQYHVVTVFRYFNPECYQRAVRQLAPGGEILVEVHLQTQVPVAGPTSNRFRARPGALEALFATFGLDAITRFEGLVTDPDGKRMALARYRGRLAKGG